jgi:hypothetical protein
MGKEKKHSGPERGGGGKGGKGIQKDNNSHYGYPPQQQQQRGNYNRPADKKSPMPEYTNRPRPSASTLPPPPSTNNKNAPKMPRPEQISETVGALGALEAVLNSYE